MLKKIFRKMNNNQAFTIIEILLAIALLAIVSIAIGSIIISTQNNTAQMFSDTELQQQLVEVQENLHNEILGTNAGIKCWIKSPGNEAWSKSEINGQDAEEVVIGFYNLDIKDYTLTKTYYRYNKNDKTIVVGHGTPDVVSKTTKNNCNLCHASLNPGSNKCPNCGATIIDKIEHTVDPDVQTALSAVSDWSLVAANVEHFIFNVQAYKENKLIAYEVRLESAESVYPADETVYMRNDINVNKDVFQIEKYHHVAIKIPTLQYTSFKYDGMPHGPAEENYLERFVNKAGTFTATDCGTYTITYSLKDKLGTTWEDGTTDDKVHTWSIAERALTLQWGTTKWKYDGQKHYATCSPIGVLDGDDCEIILTNSEIGPNVGTVTCTATTSNPNYGIPTLNTVTLEIEPIDPTVENLHTVRRVYLDSKTEPGAGEPQNMVAYDKIVGGTLQFYIDNKKTDWTPTDNLVNKTTCSATNAGTYYVWYKIVPINNNYNPGTVKYLGEAVMERAPTASVESQNFTYDGSWHNGVYGIGVIIEPTHTAKSAGQYTATVKPDSNHCWSNGDINTVSRSWEIFKADGSVIAPVGYDDLEYNGELQTLIKTAAISEHGHIEYKLGATGEWTTEFPRAMNARDDAGYEVYYRASGDSNHNPTDGTDFIRVPLKRARQAFVNVTNRTFNGEPQLGYIDKNHVTITGIYNRTDYGDYRFYATPIENYAWSDGSYNSKECNWSINKAEVTFKSYPTALKPVYNGEAQKLITTGNTSHGKFWYSTNYNPTTGTGTWQENVPVGIDATTYKVYYKVVGDSNHLDVAPQLIQNVLIQRSPTAQAYATNPRYTGNVVQGVYGEHVTWTGITSATEIGEYKATATLDPNYTWPSNSINYGKGEKVEITWNLQKAMGYCDAPIATNPKYNGQLQNMCLAPANSSGTVEYSWSESGGWSTTIPQKRDVGTYTLYYRVLATSINDAMPPKSIEVSVVLNNSASVSLLNRTYSESAQNGYTAITNATITRGTASATTVGEYTFYAKPNEGYCWIDEYGGGTTEKMFTWQMLRSATASYTLLNPTYTGETVTGITYEKCNANGAETGTTVGTYTITLTPKEGYAWAETGKTDPIEVKWNVLKANATYTAPTAKTGLVYTGQALYLINSGTASGGTMQYKVGSGSWSTTPPSATNAGKYTVYYKVVGDENHNNVEEQSLEVTIAKKKISKPVNSKTEYDGSEKTVQLVCNAGEGIVWTGTTKATSSGDYSATATLNSNYLWSDGTDKPCTITWTIEGFVYSSKCTLRVKAGAVFKGGTTASSIVFNTLYYAQKRDSDGYVLLSPKKNPSSSADYTGWIHESYLYNTSS